MMLLENNEIENVAHLELDLSIRRRKPRTTTPYQPTPLDAVWTIFCASMFELAARYTKRFGEGVQVHVQHFSILPFATSCRKVRETCVGHHAKKVTRVTKGRARPQSFLSKAVKMARLRWFPRLPLDGSPSLKSLVPPAPDSQPEIPSQRS
jgi:hypothetical protein